MDSARRSECGRDADAGKRGEIKEFHGFGPPRTLFYPERTDHSGLLSQLGAATRATGSGGCRGRLRLFRFGLSLQPLVRLLLGRLLRHTVALRQTAHKLLFAARYVFQVVVSEFAPLLLDRPFHLLPLTLHLIPVHDLLLTI